MTGVRVLTPPGRGAIAVVEVTGSDATRAIDEGFVAANGRRCAEQPIDAIRFGRWTGADETPGEELVIVRTAADRVEVHCHGGAAAVAAIVRSLGGDTGEEHEEPIASIADQAWCDLRHAPTERAAAVLLDQANGALTGTITEAIADLDRGDRDNAIDRLRSVLSHERLGSHLLTPWRVVLAGPPNAGKSSLINALLGYDRAIVYDQPGTTRDVVTPPTAIGGWPVLLADTAGVRETSDPLEAAGVELARETLASADIVVLVREAVSFDSTKAIADRDRLLESAAAGAWRLEVASKADLLAEPGPLPPGVIATSVSEGLGVDRLLAAIEDAMAIGPLPTAAPVPFRPEQVACFRAALDALANDDPSTAKTLLQSLLAGERP